MGKQQSAANAKNPAKKTTKDDKVEVKNVFGRKLAVRQERNRRAEENRAAKNRISFSDTEIETMSAQSMKDKKDRKLKAAEARALKNMGTRGSNVGNFRTQVTIDTDRAIAAKKAALEDLAVKDPFALAEIAKRKSTQAPITGSPDAKARSASNIKNYFSSPVKKKTKASGSSESPEDEAMATITEGTLDNLVAKITEGTNDDEVQFLKAVQQVVPVQESSSVSSVESSEDGKPAATDSPKKPPSILKKTMLEAAKASEAEQGLDNFFQAKKPGSNKERIPSTDFINKVFVEVTIPIPPKPKDTKGLTPTQHAWNAITDFVTMAQADVSHSLIVLAYVMTHPSEPEAVLNVKKYVKGVLAQIKKHVFGFRLQNNATGNYPMYLTFRFGTNAHGEDLTQLLEDLKGVDGNVYVYKSALQRANQAKTNWIMNSHRNFDDAWFTNFVNNILVQLHAGTCAHTLPDLDKKMFVERELIALGFSYRSIYDGSSNKKKDKKDLKYALHVICEKKNKTIARLFMNSILESPVLRRNLSLEFRMVPTFQNDNGPSENAKLRESIDLHKKVQDKLLMATIADLESLDVRATLSEEQQEINSDSATVVAEKRNPTARSLLMRIEKKDNPGVKLFTDVSANWNNAEYIASFPEAWKDEARFTASNAAAFLFRKYGEVGLSFFPSQVRKTVRSQGWNEVEDRPVTAGEEQLDSALKPYAKDSAMLKMFDFSKMDETPLKKDLQNPGLRPAKDNQGSNVDSPLDTQALANKEAFSLHSADQSKYYEKDGTPRPVNPNRAVTFGDNTTLGSGAVNEDDDFSIRTNEQSDFNMFDADSVVTNKTTTSARTTGSLARERFYQQDRKKFNDELTRVKEHHRLEMENMQRRMTSLNTATVDNGASVTPQEQC